jgi:hypothetical protein
MRRAIVVIAVLVVIVAVVTVIGYFLPVSHTATAQRTYDRPVAAVWSMITTVERYPAWRPSVKSVEVLSPPGKRLRWRETWNRGNRITFRVTEKEEPRLLVVAVDDDDLPFGGRWTYGLSPAGNGCTLTITEDGEVYNPIFRFVSRLFMDPTRSINTYLDDLEEGISNAKRS